VWWGGDSYERRAALFKGGEGISSHCNRKNKRGGKPTGERENECETLPTSSFAKNLKGKRGEREL